MYRFSQSRKPKRSKYGNTKVTADGLDFDSKLEYEFYKFFLSSSDYKLIDRQVKVVLINGLKHPTGETLKELSYKADFLVEYKGQELLFVDSKGMRTKEFQIKYKMMTEKYYKGETHLLLVAKSLRGLSELMKQRDEYSSKLEKIALKKKKTLYA